jgi:hypothetical protein
MAKGKTANKWAKQEKPGAVPTFRTSGNVLDGYTVIDREGNALARYENVRDAVAEKDRLSGEGSE